MEYFENTINIFRSTMTIMNKNLRKWFVTNDWFSTAFILCLIFFMFSPNDCSEIIIKNAYYFIEEAYFVPNILTFLYFHLPLFFSLF